MLFRSETITAYNNKFEGEINLEGCESLKTLDIYYAEESSESSDESSDSSDTSKEDASEESSELVSEESSEAVSESSEAVSEEASAETSEDAKEETPLGVYLNIKNCANLTSVNAYGIGITATPDLTGCEKLTTLDLHDNAITEVGDVIKPVKTEGEGEEATDVYVLTTLNLSGNKLQSMNGLEKINTLTSLNLSKNELTAISGIDKLTKLTSLDVSYNIGLDKDGINSAIEALPKTSTLSLNLVGTKVAGNSEYIINLQTEYSTMKITYVEETKEEDKTETSDTSADASEESSEASSEESSEAVSEESSEAASTEESSTEDSSETVSE